MPGLLQSIYSSRTRLTPSGIVRRAFQLSENNAKEVLRILDKVRSDNLKGPSFTQPADGRETLGRGWDLLTQKMETVIRKEGIYDAENQEFNRWFAGPPVGSAAHYFNHCFMLYRLVDQMDRWGVLRRFGKRAGAAPTSNREVVINGGAFSSDTLMALYQLLSIAEHDEAILNERRLILDLGAGWGRIGYVLSLINPDAVYIHCDIPITSIVAQFHLPAKLPETHCYSYEDTRALSLTRDALLSRPGVHFFGSHDLVRFEDNSFDFALNIASFQEMSNNTVTSYLKEIDRTVSGLFYMKQYMLPNNKDGFLTEGNEYYPFPQGWEKLFLMDSRISYQYFESLHRISAA
jgi:putative sugar O-methyltransferase